MKQATVNPIEELRRREAEQANSGNDAYWRLAQRVAEDKKASADEIEAALRATGRSIEDFEAHVGLFRGIANAEADATELGDLAELVEAEQDADREHRKLLERHRRIVEKELPEAELESMQRCRVAEAATKRARKAQAAVTAAHARLRAAQGHVEPEHKAPERPPLVAVHRRLGEPRDPALFDRVQRADGTLGWRNKRTGQIED